jgi:hypothetical protein
VARTATVECVAVGEGFTAGLFTGRGRGRGEGEGSGIGGKAIDGAVVVADGTGSSLGAVGTVCPAEPAHAARNAARPNTSFREARILTFRRGPPNG